MEQLLLFNLPEKQYPSFSDLINLKGEEKKDALDKMRDFVENFKGIESPTKTEKRLYFRAITLLEADAIRQAQRLKITIDMFGKMKKEIVMAELETFKIKTKLEFMERYQEQISKGEFTGEMSKELDKITRMETVGCYHVEGIDISMKNCDMCKHKICMKKQYFEQETGEEEK